MLGGNLGSLLYGDVSLMATAVQIMYGKRAFLVGGSVANNRYMGSNIAIKTPLDG